MPDGEKAFLTVAEVALLIGASTVRTYALVSDGTIPAVRFGRRVRIPRPAFNQWLADLSQNALEATRLTAARGCQ
jgi:excisionase family DNA binding protein